MKTSDSVSELFKAMHAAQAEIAPAVKDSTNPHFKSKYADLTAVWTAIHGAMAGNDLALIQLPMHSEDGRVHLSTRIVHSSGQWLEETASIPVVKQDPHGYGSGLTYLRRYAAASLMFLATEDDDGNAAVEKAPAPKIGMSATDVAKEALADMEPAEQEYLKGESMTIMGLPDGPAMVEYIGKQKYDTEEKLALWALLPSNVRSAIKKNTKVTPAELAAQP